MQAAGLDWDGASAHSAVYDAERTAELFCTILNRWASLTEQAADGARWSTEHEALAAQQLGVLP